jgi:hypothetical protein
MVLQAWLDGLYFFATVFGVGVTAVDMLGILGNGGHHAHGAQGDHGHVAHDGVHHGAHVPLLSILRYLRMGVYFAL